MSSFPNTIEITEVGPRDGFQNLSDLIPTDTKVSFIDRLSKTGLKRIEVTAFVNPEWIPQLSDADEVFQKIDRQPEIVYSALVPNERGWERAETAKVNEIGVLTAASETFCEKNINTSIEGSIMRFTSLIERAHDQSMNVRCYVSTVVACPYEGKTEPQVVRELVMRLQDCGVDDIDLGDTIGVATPIDIRRLYDSLEGVLEPTDSILHVHNTNGQALMCAKEAMHCGVFRFDASCGGLGGCPFAPDAAGNLATEDLVNFAHQNGIETGVDLQSLFKATAFVEPFVECAMTSEVYLTSKEAT